jgi:hypothetical protein
MFSNWVNERQKIVYINLYNNISLCEISGTIMHLGSPLVHRPNVRISLSKFAPDGRFP